MLSLFLSRNFLLKIFFFFRPVASSFYGGMQAIKCVVVGDGLDVHFFSKFPQSCDQPFFLCTLFAANFKFWSVLLKHTLFFLAYLLCSIWLGW